MVKVPRPWDADLRDVEYLLLWQESDYIKEILKIG